VSITNKKLTFRFLVNKGLVGFPVSAKRACRLYGFCQNVFAGFSVSAKDDFLAFGFLSKKEL
jgi:hypothetical protein